MSWLTDLFNPPAANLQAPPTWTAPNMTGAANNALGGIQNLGQYNAYSQFLPQAMQTAQAGANNPYGQDWLQAAQQAGNMGMQGAQNMFNQGGNLYGGGNQVMNTAFDPQNDLYSRTAGQVQQQSRSGQAARGVLTSPYGAGLEDQDMRNFNIDWQNNQLGRQIQGGQAAAGMFGQGANMQGAAPGMFNTAGAMPYNAYSTQGQNALQMLGLGGQFGQQAGAQANMPVQDWLQYMGAGTQANQVNNQNFQNQLAQNKLATDQQGAMFGGLGKMVGLGMQFVPGMQIPGMALAGGMGLPTGMATGGLY